MSAVAKRPHVATHLKRAMVVDLILAGKSQNAIANELGMDESTVRYHKQGWLEAQAPSLEQTEELRKTQAAQIDALVEALWPRRDEDSAVDRLVRLMDRKARLMGLDIDRGVGVTVNVLTREWLAEQLAEDAPVVDVEATEETGDGE